MCAAESKRDRSDKVLMKGIDLFQSGDIAGAIQQFNVAIKIEPNNEVAWNDKGLALKIDGNMDEAVKCYSKAIKIDPDYEEAWYNLGNALAAKGDFDRAIKSFDRALEIVPDDVEARANRDWCREESLKKKEFIAKREKKRHRAAAEPATVKSVQGTPPTTPASAKKAHLKPKPRLKVKEKAPPAEDEAETHAPDGSVNVPPAYKEGSALNVFSGEHEALEEIKDNMGKIRALLSSSEPTDIENIEIDEETKEAQERTDREREELKAALEGTKQVTDALNNTPETSPRKAELEHKMAELKEKIEVETQAFEEKRTQIENDIRSEEEVRSRKEKEHNETILKKEIEIESKMLEDSIEKEIAVDVGAELLIPKKKEEITHIQKELKEVEEDAKRELERHEKVVEGKKKEFTEIIKEEEDFLKGAREEEERLRRELETEARKMADYMEKFLEEEGIEF